MMQLNKKTWEKPELTVLVRNSPEESVLTGCKATGSIYISSAYNGCSSETEYTGTGGLCPEGQICHVCCECLMNGNS